MTCGLKIKVKYLKSVYTAYNAYILVDSGSSYFLTLIVYGM